jgi:hypothetical protein
MAAARKSSRYGHRDATMILIGYRHGLRASELCDLQWSQVELATGRLHVRRAKNGSPSVHPMQGRDGLDGSRTLINIVYCFHQNKDDSKCEVAHPHPSRFSYKVVTGTKTALCRLPGIAPRSKESAMVSGAYLRQQAEILIAMSRATFDLGVAERLRAMASELQTRAAEQEDKRGSNDNELANVRAPSGFRIGS